MSYGKKVFIRSALFSAVILITNIVNEFKMYTTDKIGISFIKNAEGFSPVPYKCSAGKSTIGYGHVISDGERLKLLTKDEGVRLLMQDVKTAENAVNKYVSAPLNKGQFNALVSLVYNVGVGAFKKSKALKYLNEGNYDLATIEFFDKDKGFVKSKGVIVAGLVTRRKRELYMWEGTDYA